MKYNWGDSWDGFDAKQYVYDEHKEKKWRTGIWKILFCLMALIILYIITNHIDEIRLVKEGTMIEAEYDAKKSFAQDRDENGSLHIYNLSSYYPEHEGDMVRLYYTDSINYARPRNTLSSRIFHYCFFGGLLALSVWRIKKNS